MDTATMPAIEQSDEARTFAAMVNARMSQGSDAIDEAIELMVRQIADRAPIVGLEQSTRLALRPIYQAMFGRMVRAELARDVLDLAHSDIQL